MALTERRLSLRFGTAMAILVAVIVAGPFYLARFDDAIDPDVYRVPQTHDMAQHISVMKQFHQAVRWGDLYPRWQSEFNKGYGLPWLNYYPPGFYFLTELFYRILGDWYLVLFVVTIVCTTASGLAFFVLGRQFYSDAASAIGALFYMVTPYHTLDLYWRGALPELTAFFFVPVTVLLAFRSGRDGRAWQIAGLGLAQGLFILFHFPTSYILLPALAGYAVVWAAIAGDWRIAARIALGVITGFAVSAGYWLPALLQRKHVWEPFTQLFPYHKSYITFLPRDDVFGNIITHSFVGLLVALVISVMIVRADKRDLADAPQTRLFRWLAAATLFMVTPYSSAFAGLIPHIDAVSFPWRWLVLGSCFCALALTAAADVASLRPSYRLAIVAAFAFNIALSVQLIVPALARTNTNLYAPVGVMENGFRPGRAGDVASLPDTEPVVLDPPGGGTASIADWSPSRREVLLDLHDERRVRLKTYRFRGWIARIDGQVVPIETDSYAAQVVHVPPGRHKLVVTFENVRLTTYAELISILAILGAAVTIVVDGFRWSRRVS